MKSSLKKAVTALLAAALLAATPCTPVFGAQTYYVNDGSSTLTMADAYAVGASGDAAKLPDRGVYAATANGTQMLGGTEYAVLHRVAMPKHQLSHRTIHACFYEIEVEAFPHPLPPDGCVVADGEVSDYAVSRLTELYLQRRG